MEYITEREETRPTGVRFFGSNPYLRWGETMPLAPHYPSDEPRRDRRTPDIDDIVDDILGRGDDGPQPVVR